jgi:hypothetical protein
VASLADLVVVPIDPKTKKLKPISETLANATTSALRGNEARADHITRRNLNALAEQFGKERGRAVNLHTASMKELNELGGYITRVIEEQTAARDAHSSWNPFKWTDNTRKQHAAIMALGQAQAALKELGELENEQVTERTARTREWVDSMTSALRHPGVGATPVQPAGMTPDGPPNPTPAGASPSGGRARRE